jgi:hypothetical protein
MKNRNVERKWRRAEAFFDAALFWLENAVVLFRLISWCAVSPVLDAKTISLVALLASFRRRFVYMWCGWCVETCQVGK